MCTIPDWKLESSAAIAHDLIADETNRELRKWFARIKTYTAAKQRLIDALDPDTGRREVPVTYDPPNDERSAAWRNALRGNAQSAATTAFYDAEISRLSLAGETSERAERAAKSVEKKQHLVNLFTAHSEALRQFAAHVSGASFAEGKISYGRDLLPSIYPGTKDGQAIGRALSGYLRYLGCTTEDAALLCDAISSAALPKARSGTIVLSANVLDLLTVSESCSYSSCHSFDGCHRAGPQQYLYDPHTIVSYYYEEGRPYNGFVLPYKLQRQMIFVDAQRQAAAIQRNYGRTLPDSVQVSLRREVARLLCRLTGLPDGEPKWKVATERGDTRISAGCDLIYLDPTECYVSLTGDRPHIQLAERVLCLACSRSLDSAERMLCSNCLSSLKCYGCNCDLDEDDSYTPEGSDVSYCSDCYSERYSTCERCNSEVSSEDIVSCPGSDYYCGCCANRYYPECAKCDARFAADDLDADGHCEECSETTCAECGDSYPPEELSDGTEVPDTERNCPDCVETQRHRIMLCQRLIRSPRFVRASAWEALYFPDFYRCPGEEIIRQWSDKSTVETSRTYAVSILYPLVLESIQ